jgi:hypothetical protein
MPARSSTRNITPLLVSATVSPQTIAVAGLGSAAGFGVLTVNGAKTLAVGAVASAQAFGVPTLKLVLRTTPGAVLSAQAFGVPTVRVVLRATPGAVASAQAFGVPTVRVAPFVAHPNALGSAQAFGAVTIRTQVVVPVTGVPTAQLLGTDTPKPGPVRISVPGVLPFGYIVSICGLVVSGDGHLCGFDESAQFGHPNVFDVGDGAHTYIVPGVPSAQAFGSGDAYIVRLRDLVCIDRTLVALDCDDLTLIETTRTDMTLAPLTTQ